MRLRDAHKALLIALQAGSRLQVHRDLDGAKIYQLHALGDATSQELPAAMVMYLERHGLIESNLKFPAATFLLTDKGVQLAAQLSGSSRTPMGPRNFSE
ncbi:MAG: hypothetical protein H3C34_13200 [Caldilineaceae bacterium]|nr:hypothetical protein [Caldilineaceae bacterium]